MTTASSYGTFAHSSSATFQAWVTEWHNLLIACGLTQTSDTGQVNPATIVFSNTVNAVAGYEVYKFSDSLQATAPVFIKFEYGNSNAGTPAIFMTIGTSTDGAGTITGTTYFARLINGQTSTVLTPVSTVQQYLSQAVHNTTTGHLGVFFKESGASMNGSTTCDFIDLIIARTCDSSGNPTAEGVLIIWGIRNTTSSLPTVKDVMYVFSTGYTIVGASNQANSKYSYVYYSITNSIRSGQVQCVRFYTVTPNVAPIVSMITCINAEISPGSIFTATCFATPHSYLALNFPARSLEFTGSANYNPCILWE